MNIDDDDSMRLEMEKSECRKKNKQFHRFVGKHWKRNRLVDVDGKRVLVEAWRSSSTIWDGPSWHAGTLIEFAPFVRDDNSIRISIPAQIIGFHVLRSSSRWNLRVEWKTTNEDNHRFFFIVCRHVVDKSALEHTTHRRIGNGNWRKMRGERTRHWHGERERRRRERKEEEEEAEEEDEDEGERQGKE